MKLSYSDLILFCPEGVKGIASEYGEGHAGHKLQLSSSEYSNTPFIELSICNDAEDKWLHIRLQDIHCKQIIQYLQSHIE